MKAKKLECPYCGATVDVNIQGRTSVFCSYCGQPIHLDDEKREFTYNKNINVSKTTHKRYTDDADVIRATTESKQTKNDIIMVLTVVGIFLLIAALAIGIPTLRDAVNEGAGKVQVGDYQDLIGQDYKTVEAHFKAAGFTNIELIDLSDSGLAFWLDGDVTMISVGGKTEFSSLDWFDPNVKVVISHH